MKKIIYIKLLLLVFLLNSCLRPPNEDQLPISLRTEHLYGNDYKMTLENISEDSLFFLLGRRQLILKKEDQIIEMDFTELPFPEIPKIRKNHKSNLLYESIKNNYLSGRVIDPVALADFDYFLEGMKENTVFLEPGKSISFNENYSELENLDTISVSFWLRPLNSMQYGSETLIQPSIFNGYKSLDSTFITNIINIIP